MRQAGTPNSRHRLTTIRLRQTVNIINQSGASANGGAHNVRLVGINRDGNIDGCMHRLDNWNNPIKLSVFFNRYRAWPSGLTADINDVGTRIDEITARAPWRRRANRGGHRRRRNQGLHLKCP